MITRVYPTPVNLDQLRLVSLALQDESVVLGEPATVQLQVNEETVATVVAEVVKRQGVDGGYYPAVRLRLVEGGIGDGDEGRQATIQDAGAST